MCNIGPVGSDNLIREELVPCRVNKRNPKELLDYANQQFTVDKFNAKITKLITKFFFIVGENQIDNGLRGTTEETAELLTSFENNRRAGTVDNAIAMELTKRGSEIVRGYDIGLIQMVNACDEINRNAGTFVVTFTKLYLSNYSLTSHSLV